MVSLANYGEIEKVRLAGEGCLKKKKNQFAKSKQPFKVNFIYKAQKEKLGRFTPPHFLSLR
jgi:hypothetical protein